MNPLVVIPTYNERNNVEFITEKLLGLRTHLDILFVDDNSPDGTGILLDALAEKNPSVWVLHRNAKEGIGSAHLAGLSWAREKGYQTVITMGENVFSESIQWLDSFQSSTLFRL